MPTPSQVTESLTLIANECRPLAFAWHLLLAAGVLFVAAGWWPRKRPAAVLLAVPCWTVAAVAWYYGNPFNGVLFLMLALALTIIASTLPFEDLRAGSRFDRVAGAALIAFGVVYPHFLQTGSWLEYAYESPFGLIPCPTLSLVVGVSLFADGFESRAWMWCLTLAAAFYGVLGTVVLSVWIDALLLAGALLLGAKALRQPGRILNRLGDFSHAR